MVLVSTIRVLGPQGIAWPPFGSGLAQLSDEISEAARPLTHGERGDGGHRGVLGHARVQPRGGEGERDRGDAREITAAHGARHGDTDL